MRIRTPADLGALIRDHRKKLGLDQADLARRIGVSRQWVIEIERGHVRAELGLVLRALDALAIRLSGGTESVSETVPSVDIDAIVAATRKTKR